jgi:hypothetical protein
MGPIRDTLRDFIVHPEVATRPLMRELGLLLKGRSGVEDEANEEKVDDEKEGEDEDGTLGGVLVESRHAKKA